MTVSLRASAISPFVGMRLPLVLSAVKSEPKFSKANLGQSVTCPVKIGARTVPLTYQSYTNYEAREVMLNHRTFGPILKEALESQNPLYATQIGLKKPTFLSIIGPARETLREAPYFDLKEAVRIIISDGIWKYARRSDMVVDLRDPQNPQVFVDRLSPLDFLRAGARFLRARIAGVGVYRRIPAEEILRGYLATSLQQVHSSSVNDDIQRRRLFNVLKKAGEENDFIRSQLGRMDFYQPALFLRKTGGHGFLVVSGSLIQDEAVNLVNEIIKNRALRRQFGQNFLDSLGSVFISLKKDGIDIQYEKNSPENTRKIEALTRFVKGFNQQIVVSDIHLASGGGEDHFGPKKAADFEKLLDGLIDGRGTLIVNGDLFDLWMAKYGDIRRAYPALFQKLAAVRRIICIAGNHDNAILEDHPDEKQLEILACAQKNVLPGGLVFDRRGDFLVNEKNRKIYKKLLALLNHPDFQDQKKKLSEKARAMYRRPDCHPQLIMSFSLTDTGPGHRAFRRSGSPIVYVDQKILTVKDKAEAARRLYETVFDNLRNLPTVVKKDFPNMIIVPNHFDPHRRMYLEHGHIPDVFNYRSPVGPFIAGAGAVLGKIGKLFGYQKVQEHFELICGLPQRLAPAAFWAGYPYLEKALGLSKMFEWYGVGKPMSIIFGHTHEAEMDEHFGIGAFLQKLANNIFINTGTWSGEKPRGIHPEFWKRRVEKFKAAQAAGRSNGRENWFSVDAQGRIAQRNGVSDFNCDAQVYDLVDDRFDDQVEERAA